MHTQLRDPLPPQLNALTTSCKYEPDERSDPLNAETSGRSHLSDATSHRPRQKQIYFYSSGIHWCLMEGWSILRTKITVGLNGSTV